MLCHPDQNKNCSLLNEPKLLKGKHVLKNEKAIFFWLIAKHYFLRQIKLTIHDLKLY